jgi:hypothetical protein
VTRTFPFATRFDFIDSIQGSQAGSLRRGGLPIHSSDPFPSYFRHNSKTTDRNRPIPIASHTHIVTSLEIKATHKPIKDYYTALEEFEHNGLKKETTVRAAFAEVLQTYARKKKWSFVEEYGFRGMHS